MKINDVVMVVDSCTKYKEYNIIGCIGIIMTKYGEIVPNYGVKIDSRYNKGSKEGLFYLKADQLAKFNAPLPVYAPVYTGPGIIATAVPNPILKQADYDFVKSDIMKHAFENTCSIKKVIFNRPATIVLWSDGTKTVVKRQKGDRWDREKGLAMCLIKKLCGNNGSYYKIFKRYCDERKETVDRK